MDAITHEAVMLPPEPVLLDDVPATRLGGAFSPHAFAATPPIPLRDRVALAASRLLVDRNW